MHIDAKSKQSVNFDDETKKKKTICKDILP